MGTKNIQPPSPKGREYIGCLVLAAILIVVMVTLIIVALPSIIKIVVGVFSSLIVIGVWVSIIGSGPIVSTLANFEQISQLVKSIRERCERWWNVIIRPGSEEVPPKASVVIICVKTNSKDTENIIEAALKEMYDCDIHVHIYSHTQTLIDTFESAKYVIFVLSHDFLTELEASQEENTAEKILLEVANSADPASKGVAAILDRSSSDFASRLLSLKSFSLHHVLDDESMARRHVKASVFPKFQLPRRELAQGSVTVIPQVDSYVRDNQNIWIVPHRKNKFFMDHKQTDYALSRLQEHWEHEGVEQQVLWGLPGMGKTQIALAFVYEYGLHDKGQGNRAYCCVLWLDATNSLDTGLEKLNEALQLPSESDEFKRFKTWITEYEKDLPENKKWLLIIDNCGIEDVEKAQMMLPIPLSYGHVLFTMQERPEKLGYDAKRIRVQGMTKDDGTQLLVWVANDSILIKVESLSQEYREDARRVVEELGGNPLAIDNAGAYMAECRISPHEYLELYRKKCGEILTSPLRSRFHVGSSYDSIVATFILSFTGIEKLPKAGGAEQALLLCAFLAAAPIPKDIVRFMPREDCSLPWLADAGAVDQALKRLFDFSLIEHDEKKLLTVHALVREVIRLGFYPHVKQKVSDQDMVGRKVYAVKAVSVAFSKSVVDQKEYLPHVKECVAYIRDIGLASMEAVQLLRAAGLYLKEYFEYEEVYGLAAVELLRESVRMLRQLWGKKPQDVGVPHLPTYLNSLAEFYHERVQYEDAEKCYREALVCVRQSSQQTAVAGSVDEATLRNNLGRLYSDQGNEKDAEEQLLRAFSRRDKAPKLPLEDEREKVTLLLNQVSILNNLGNVCVKAARYEEAEKKYQKAMQTLEDVEKILDITPDLSLKTMHEEYKEQCETNLASLYACWGGVDKYKAAERYYRRAIERSKKLVQRVGHTSEQTYIQLVTRLNNLASLYLIWGENEGYDNKDNERYKNAFKHYKEALGYYFNYYSKKRSITGDQKGRKEVHPVLKVIWDNLDALPDGMLDKGEDEFERYALTLKLTNK